MRINLVFTLFITNIFYSYSQQVAGGYAPYIADFSVPLLSGFYGGPNPNGKTPDSSNEWHHLFTIRHGNPENNNQLQISSSFSLNDRLFFRKISTGLTAQNPDWIEIATRAGNSFTGNQYVNGAILSAIPSDTGGQLQLINPSKSGSGIASTWTIYNMKGIYGNSLQFWAYDNLSCGGGLCANRFTIMDNGNVGIGIMVPNYKLDVNGTIHSKEVKVDMTGWSDFVFKKEYNLPTLEEVEKHIAEKGHLENIPSEEEVLKNGINLGEMNAKLLQKIEELTLYMIEMKKENEEIKIENKKQNEKIMFLESKLILK
ncbi:hypothetical protein [Flavobacterium anhuiense]|uniref:hypothetical protein n=1 Tax=Flavobacterium anhuiense TaxID=459526 RepID=UPI0020265781|nr:hypothetical protein [Flavobacterium anhuiense]URM35525.1 hypothetical protein LLY39_13835 [Flavobacterium anhuiense]